MRIIRTVPLHPLLAAVLPILLVYSGNVDETSLASVARPVAVMLIGCLLLWAPAALALRSATKAGVLVSLAMVLFWSLMPLAGVLTSVRPRFLLCAMAVLLAGVAYLLARTRSRLADLTTVLNTSALCVTAVVVITIAQQLTRPTVAVTPTATVEEGPGRQLENAPDIYYIILDGYGRADVLQDIYGFDNSEFLEQLRQRGFFVCGRSACNYSTTGHSIPSSLSMCYLNELARVTGTDETDGRSLGKLLRGSQVARLLRSNGYVCAAFASGHQATDQLPWVDHWVRPQNALSEFELTLLTITPLPEATVSLPRLFRGGLLDPYECRRRTVLNVFDRLAEPRERPRPVFVFAHILCPHPPFVFAGDGTPVQPQRPFRGLDLGFYAAGGSREEYLRGYREQLAFANHRVIEAVDQILSAAQEPVIIVLQGDHGPNANEHLPMLHRSRLRERFPILNAYLVPDEIATQLYDEITPVNTFRLILNYLYVADCGLLQDRSYASSYERPYEFSDVTDEVRGP